MACYKPMTAYKTDNGEVVFSPGKGNLREFKLPCGGCIGCRLERARQWAIRCQHESEMHSENCFITLTYSPEHLPPNGSLHYPDFQLFMKRLRNHAHRKEQKKNIRFYMCGEYGDLLSRPHYHALLFGYDFSDRVPFFKTKRGRQEYVSETLTSLWGLGHCTVGDSSFNAAGYAARYIFKKQTGNHVNPDTGLPYKEHYYVGNGQYKTPEFNCMSRKPGIGRTWWDKYKDQVKAHDHIVINGRICKPPKFYDKLHALEDPLDFEATRYQRYLESIPFAENSTPERLEVREEVALRKLGHLPRTLEGSNS